MPAKGASCSEIDPPRKSAGLCVRCPYHRNERWGHGNLRNRNGEGCLCNRQPSPFRFCPSFGPESLLFGGGAPPPKSRPPFANRGRGGRKVVSCGPDSDSARFARVSQNRSGGGQPDVPCPDAPFPSERCPPAFSIGRQVRRGPAEGPAARFFALREAWAESRCR